MNRTLLAAAVVVGTHSNTPASTSAFIHRFVVGTFFLRLTTTTAAVVVAGQTQMPMLVIDPIPRHTQGCCICLCVSSVHAIFESRT